MNIPAHKFQTYCFAIIVTLLFSAPAYAIDLIVDSFFVVIKTNQPAEKFVVWVNNYDYACPGSGHGPCLDFTEGGGYMKVTHGSANSRISFPSGARYTLLGSGTNGLDGKVWHPHFAETQFGIAVNDEGVRTVRVKVTGIYEESYRIPPGEPAVIYIPAITMEKYMDTNKNQIIRDISRGEDSRLKVELRSSWESHLSLAPDYFSYFDQIGMKKMVCEKYMPYLIAMDTQYFEPREYLARDKPLSIDKCFGGVNNGLYFEYEPFPQN